MNGNINIIKASKQEDIHASTSCCRFTLEEDEEQEQESKEILKLRRPSRTNCKQIKFYKETHI